MGNNQTNQRSEQYNVEDTADDEPVIIREVKPATEKTVTQIPVLFKWQHTIQNIEAGVCLSGSFNGWEKQPMVKTDGEYTVALELPPGQYEYKYFVDGTWQHDSFAKSVENKFGSHNNVITVSVSDASLCISCQNTNVSTVLDYDELTAEKDKYSDEGFTQKIPDMSMYTTAGPPPQLPVQLRRGILNAESEDSSDPTLLPEPQHVLLNHLYALTVRDGVMVLGATHRYKRKYVTTMLYKPIAA